MKKIYFLIFIFSFCLAGMAKAEVVLPNIVIKDITISPSTMHVNVIVENIGDPLHYETTKYIYAQDLNTGKKFVRMVSVLDNDGEKSFALDESWYINEDNAEVEENETGIYNIKAWVDDSTMTKEIDISEMTEEDLEIYDIEVNLSEDGTSATIKWKTNIDSGGEVEFSGRDGREDIPIDKEEKNHELLLDDLNPQSKYSYRIVARSSDGQSESPGFKDFTTLGVSSVPLPDLTVNDVFFTPHRPKANEVFNGQLHIILSNLGEAATQSKSGVYVIVSVPGYDITKTYKNIDNIEAKKTADVQFDIRFAKFTKEPLKIEVWLDSNALSSFAGELGNDNLAIDESDETNNTFSKTFALDGGEDEIGTYYDIITIREKEKNIEEGDLDLDMDKVALSSDKIPENYVFASFNYWNRDPNMGIQPEETVYQRVTDKDNSKVSNSAYLYIYKNEQVATDAYNYKTRNNSAPESEISEADKFSPNIYCRGNNESTKDIFAFSCLLRYRNVIVYSSNSSYVNNNKSALSFLKRYYDSIINYDGTKIPPIPNLTEEEITKSIEEMANQGDAQLTSNSPKDSSLYDRLRGKIILKVEDAGKAYYVNPEKQTIHYLGRPDDAFSVMREQGVGITNENLNKIPVSLDSISETGQDSDNDGYTDYVEMESGYNPNGSGKMNVDSSFANSQKGKIFLQVENNGEAWYVNPSDGKRYFLGRPADAFNIMRTLGLGISNGDFGNL